MSQLTAPSSLRHVCAATPPRVIEKLAALEAEERAIAAQLEDPAVVVDHRKVRELSVKKSALAPAADAWRAILAMEKEAAGLEAIIKANDDRDLVSMARDELPTLRSRAQETLDAALSALVNADDQKIASVMLEVRAGTGGDEAALWARDLLDMYTKFAARRGWTCEALEVSGEGSAGTGGGVRSAVINLKGQGVWSEMNFEAGVHSVKRVPATEAQGRIHTSTASVAVLPEPEEVDVKIDWANDVEEGATRSQGPGGQNVNKVESAWQIHHKPTGIIIKMMEAKSQQQNRDRARRLLMARLYEAQLQKAHEQRAAAHKDQIGTAGRSEKIRTYRWKEGIVADERLPGEYQLRDLLAGDFTKLMKDLLTMQTTQRVSTL